MERIEKALVRFNEFLIGLMMIIMFVLVFTNVVTRYCFGFSIATAEEIATFLMIWVTYLGAGIALRQGRHAAIDVFQDMLGKRGQKVLRAILAVLVLGFFLLLLWYGARFAHFGMRSETIATQIPKGIPYLGVPIGAALFVAHMLFVFRRWIDRRWEGSPAGVDGEQDQGGA